MLEGQSDEIDATIKSPSSNFICDSGLPDKVFPTQTSAPQVPSIVEDYQIQLSGLTRRSSEIKPGNE
eukprot:scaffold30_cov133-Chaetoceros_neogracile.AAC.2